MAMFRLRPARRHLRYACLRDRLGEIGALPVHGPDPGFRARLRHDLLAAAATARPDGLSGYAAEDATATAPAPARRPAWRSALPRLRAGGLTVTTVAVLSVLLLVIAETYGSVPGDVFYPLKRAGEAAMLRLSADDATRAERELEAARSRAAEANALLGSDDPGRERLIGPTIQDMASTTRSALTALTHVKRNTPPTPRLRRFAREQYDLVAPMIPHLVGEARVEASAYLDMIDNLAR